MSAKSLGAAPGQLTRLVYGPAIRQDLKLLEVDEVLLESLQQEGW